MNLRTVAIIAGILPVCAIVATSGIQYVVDLDPLDYIMHSWFILGVVTFASLVTLVVCGVLWLVRYVKKRGGG